MQMPRLHAGGLVFTVMYDAASLDAGLVRAGVLVITAVSHANAESVCRSFGIHSSVSCECQVCMPEFAASLNAASLNANLVHARVLLITAASHANAEFACQSFQLAICQLDH
jgi:hypothetical protein